MSFDENDLGFAVTEVSAAAPSDLAVLRRTLQFPNAARQQPAHFRALDSALVHALLSVVVEYHPLPRHT